MGIYTFNSDTYCTSSNYIIRKMLVASLSESQGTEIAQSPITNIDTSGLSAWFHQRLNQESQLVLTMGPTIWENIAILKDNVELRGQIKEDHMKDVDESKELLDSTVKLQELVKAVTMQEEDFLSLYETVNQVVYQLYISYTDLFQQSITQCQNVIELSTKDLSLDLPQDLDPAYDILNSTHILALQEFIRGRQIDRYFSINIGDFLEKKFDHKDPVGFQIMQCVTVILARFVAQHAAKLSTDKDSIDIATVVKAVENHQSKLELALPELQDIMTQQKPIIEKLSNEIDLNRVFIKKVHDSLRGLEILSRNRKPEDLQKPEEEGMEAA